MTSFVSGVNLYWMLAHNKTYL